MTMNEMIYHRKSCRSFTGVPVGEELLASIRAFPMKPLCPDIQVRWDIVPRSAVKCICPWTTPQLITVYSEKKEGWLENVGFLFQQMDLYLQTIGLGVCWLGMGKLDPKSAPTVAGMEFVIMLAFGHPRGDQLRHERKAFKRRRPDQIADRADERLEPARLAPSSVNSQPWYFTHEGEYIHVYCTKKGLTSLMNRIDMGIVLAHLYAANEETFTFEKMSAPDVPGYGYIGTVTL